MSTHREKMKLSGNEDAMEKINMRALQIARQVADNTGTLMAAGLSNTNIYKPEDPATHAKCKDMFKEQVEWFVEGGVDYIVVETMAYLGEAMLALEAVEKYGRGLPSVVTMTTGLEDETFEGIPFTVAMTKLKDAGATVVGFNCGRGPETMLPLLRKIRQTYKGPLACLPVCYRTTEQSLSYHTLRDPDDGSMLFPMDLSCVSSSRSDISRFAKEAKDLGVQYVGLCCGACASFLREVAEGYGKRTSASKYSPDMSKSALVGNRETVNVRNDPMTRKMRQIMLENS